MLSCVLKIVQVIGKREHVSCLQGAENLDLKFMFNVNETEDNIRMINSEASRWSAMGRWLTPLRSASLTSREV